MLRKKRITTNMQLTVHLLRTVPGSKKPFRNVMNKYDAGKAKITSSRDMSYERKSCVTVLPKKSYDSGDNG